MEIFLDELKLILLGSPFFKNHSRTELASEPHYVLKDNKYTFFYKNSKIWTIAPEISNLLNNF